MNIKWFFDANFNFSQVFVEHSKLIIMVCNIVLLNRAYVYINYAVGFLIVLSNSIFPMVYVKALD